jgi:hypothetical protein
MSFYNLDESVLFPQSLHCLTLFGQELALAIDHVVVESALDDFTVGQVEFSEAAFEVEVKITWVKQ